jgi:pilus assembly protein CpaC
VNIVSLKPRFVATIPLLPLICLFQVAAWGQSQTNPGQSISGVQSGRATVPLALPRPEVSELERQNLTNLPEGDKQSIAGLLKSAKGDDATIEVIVGRGRLLTLNEGLAAIAGDIPSVAIGDPTVLDFDLLPNSRMIRILGKRVGMTDLSIVTGDGKAYTFEVQVVYDLNLLRAYLKQLYPDAHLNVVQMYEHVAIEGEASSIDVSNRILATAEAFLTSAQVAKSVQSQNRTGAPNTRPAEPEGEPADQQPQISPAGMEPENKPNITATLPVPRIINLIRVPGVQQIMLQVRIAELNRTAFRQAGSDFLYRDSHGRTFGTRLGSSDPDAGFMNLLLGTSSTAFAVIPNGTVAWVIEALRNNQILSILAEPNLVAMHGQPASFLAGGEFPVPVPQQFGAGGTGVFTVEYKQFGVLLNFVPYIMPNGAIRLHVAPEVSTIDRSNGVLANGIEIPGINTRRANSTVELHQGQTLALAGLLQADLEANTNRLPWLGDTPYLGAFFSNSTHDRAEKELVILVTPHLIDALEEHEIGCLPGQEVTDPDDKEFYWMNRIEGRIPGNCYRATSGWHNNKHSKVPNGNGSGMVGQHGFSN